MNLRIATFEVDVSPEIGHCLCGAGVPDAAALGDPQYARGVVLDDGRQRVVLCVVDYCELGGRFHDDWRNVLATAAGTTPDRVALHTVHQHDAPFLREGLVKAAAAGGLKLVDWGWWQKLSRRLATEVGKAAGEFQQVAAIGAGRAEVRKAAGNRRIIGADGRLLDTRWSITAVRKTRNAPEGTIDPWLRTLSFWSPAGKLIATLNYYATHPQCSYGRGIISADAPGEANRLVRKRFPGALHCYFTGCAGNVTLGKYSTRDKERNIRVIGQRLAAGMTAAIRDSARHKSTNLMLKWKAVPFAFPFRMQKPNPAWRKVIADSAQPSYERAYGAIKLGAWLDRKLLAHQVANVLTLGERRVLHLPGEVFIEYQLYGQGLHPQDFIACAALGDCSVGYVPLARSFKEGGYEPSEIASYTTPAVEKKLKAVIARSLKK
jgi:hypothetical protein